MQRLVRIPAYVGSGERFPSTREPSGSRPSTFVFAFPLCRALNPNPTVSVCRSNPMTPIWSQPNRQMLRLFHPSTWIRPITMVCLRRFPTLTALTTFDLYRLGLPAHGPQPCCRFLLINAGTDLTAVISDSLHRALPAMAPLFRQAFRKLVEG